MSTSIPKPPPVRMFERFLAVLAAAACLFITVAIWRSVSAQQVMWPLPALYFIEVIVLGILTALAFLAGYPAASRVAWVAAGLYLGFAVMGAFSVGIYYIPIALMFGLLAVVATVRREQSFLRGLGVFFIAVIVQAAVMFLIIRVLFPA